MKYEQKKLTDYGLKFEGWLGWTFITDPEEVEREIKRLKALEEKAKESGRVSSKTLNRIIYAHRTGTYLPYSTTRPKNKDPYVERGSREMEAFDRWVESWNAVDEEMMNRPMDV